MTVWKVCRIVKGKTRSVFVLTGNGNRYFTLSKNQKKFDLEYKIGKTTKPKIGYCMAFRTLKAAKKWTNGHYGNLKILRCKAKTKTLMNQKLFRFSPDDNNLIKINRSLWSNQLVEVSTVLPPPPGTVFCSEITPNKEVG